jgi:hypothetical protein
MKKATLLFVAVSLAGVGTACRDREEVKTEIKSETDATTGETVKTEAEAAGRLPSGQEIQAEQKMYRGTVKEIQAGEKVTIETVDGEDLSFDLGDRNTQVSLSPTVKVGSRVQVMVNQEQDQPKKITIAPLA